ncbi:MAG TPA: hypothetical protein VMW32_05690 [Bacteroidales bacterium]|nr:hypothetical protein [Bacteroidales bacterium]
MEEPVTVEVILENRTIVEKLLGKKKVRFTIKPPVLGTMAKISRIVNRISLTPDDLKKGEIAVTLEKIAQHLDDVVLVVSYAIEGGDREPDEKLKRFIKKNVTAQELAVMVAVTLNLMNPKDFTSSIILMKGMSLTKPREMIALAKETSGKQSVA